MLETERIVGDEDVMDKEGMGEDRGEGEEEKGRKAIYRLRQAQRRRGAAFWG